MTRLLLLAALLLGAVAAWLLVGGPGERSPRAPAIPAEPGADAPAPGALVEDAPGPPAERVARADPGPPDEPTTALRVLSVRSFARDAERVGGIEFELLSTADAGEIAPVGLFATLDPGRAVARGRTDDAGEALVELPASAVELDAKGRPRLRLRVVEPGYQQRLGGPSFRQQVEGEPPVLSVMAVPGATARGRVVDEDGRPVEADVRLCRRGVYGGVEKLGRSDAARKLTGGRFELDLSEDLRGVLLAEEAGVGTGSITDVALALADPPQDLEIVVHGPGSVRGRVVDAAGEPATGVELLVWLAELDDGSGSFVSPEPLFSRRRAEGRGLLWVTLQTDGDGRFAATGLRADAYVVRARTGQHDTSGYPVLLTPVPVAPDGEELELVLSRPYVVVRLAGPDGGAWSGPAPEPRTPWVAWRPLPQQWPAEPQVLGFPCSSTGEPIVSAEPLEGRAAGPAEVVYEVPDGARYLFGAIGAGFDGELSVVDVPPGAGRVEVEVRAREGLELGRVAVRVVQDGVELSGGFDLYLEDTETAAVLIAKKEYGAESPFVLEAPAGRYRVVAEGAPTINHHHGYLWATRELGRAEVEVELRAGDTIDLPLELGAGGRLELALTGEADTGDLDAVHASSAWMAAPENAEAALAESRAARIFLVRAGRRPEPVYRTVEWTGTTSAGTHLEDRWPLGAGDTSQILPAGSCRVVARLPGGREAAAPVEIRPGETTKLELRFPAPGRIR